MVYLLLYDPLLVELYKQGKGYKLSHKYRPNLYLDNYVEKELHVPVTAFMDDTSYIMHNKKDMEFQLKLTNSFYTLNNILVNKTKSEILIKERQKSTTNPREITFLFGNQTITLPYPKYNDSAQFLGVWVNFSKSQNFVIKQTRDIIAKITTSLRSKLIMDKQLLFIELRMGQVRLGN